MLLDQILSILPWGGARGQNIKEIRLSIWKIVVETPAS